MCVGDVLEAVGRTRGIYGTAIQIQDLMGFVGIINVLPLLDSVARTFLAYRLMELGASDSFFGVGTSFASLFAFVAMIYGGGFLDQFTLRTSVLTFMALDATAFIVMAVPSLPLFGLLLCLVSMFCRGRHHPWSQL